MKNILINGWVRSFISSCLLIVTFVASSAFVLAGDNKRVLLGELVVSNLGANGEQFVTINGKTAMSGASVFSSATITTPNALNATVNLGEIGRVELAPNSTMNLNFTGNLISGTLSSGQIKLFSAAGVEVKIQTKDGVVSVEPSQSNIINVNAETAMNDTTAELGTAQMTNGKGVTKVSANQQDDDEDSKKRRRRFFGFYIPLIAFGAIVTTAVAYVALKDSDNASGVIVSPTR